jgi:uncharacterized membrane protein YozB (DUF420 family)
MTLSTTIDAPRLERTHVGRWIWFFSASLFFVIAVVGFLPRSVEILTGARRNPPLVIHIHAALIVTWLGLVVVQTWLVARGKTNWHRTLGITAFTLGPAVVASMIAATIWRFAERVSLGQADVAANVLLTQARSFIYFAIFFTWAMLARKRDPETHKRMILLASFVPFGAAFTRMTWLPTTIPEAYTSIHICMLLMLVPAIAYDIVRFGRPHAAWIKGLAVLLPWMVFTELMWNNPWWRATATRLMGY